MKGRRQFGVSAAILALVAGLLAARVQAQVLVWSMGNNLAGTQAVADWMSQSGSFSSVTAYNGTDLTLTDLRNFQAILFFSNSNSGSDSLVGNVLADFADTGRRLVLATFSWANQGANTLGGRIVTDGISPFAVNGSSLYRNVTMSSNDGSPLFTGVNAISGYYHDAVSVTAGAVLNAQWSDGAPLEATRGNVVAINLFPDDTQGYLSGDYRQLFINAVAIPEASTALYLSLGLSLILAANRRLHSKSTRRLF